ncbi:nonribosomal peptide synthetase 6 [Lindgomyces ingoldianus]|uniref:Nonribosomal peptide synthetase 6 n=1 Tax=Lindgomyces ingoldianus TaxID=673940 RepID=A0ACB6QNH3_9PLEO|nr:nonribosomal peptide synthetase 6 [Lindgomyces ingoldianus]KAF2468422.1 nonribosomal peptide synthetase 6 [Lindgomyces ingoldianus]
MTKWTKNKNRELGANPKRLSWHFQSFSPGQQVIVSDEDIDHQGKPADARTLLVLKDAPSRKRNLAVDVNVETVSQDRVWTDEAVIAIPAGQNHRATLETVLVAWILLLYRYNGDSITECTWGWGGTEEVEFKRLVVNRIEGFKAVPDVANVVHNHLLALDPFLSSRFAVVVLNDGGRDDWNFRVSVRLLFQELYMESHWKPPAMSESQALTQLQYFSKILATIFQDRDLSLSRIADISQEELSQIWSWNTPLPPTINQCMHDIIRDRCFQCPEKVAVDSWDGKLTYAHIERYSTELAQNLLLLVKSPQTIIPLLFEKSRWTIVALLAVMKAGAAFALLDPAQPEGRLRAIAKQISAPLIVTSKAQAALGFRIATGVTIIPISESNFTKIDQPFSSRQPIISLPPVPPSAPLYIQFTSGSTGKPKGVVISHSNYTSGAIPRAYAVGYRSHTRCLDFASYAFDVSIDCMLCTLANGGTLCTPSEEMRINNLSGAIRDMKVTMAHMTPSVARILDPDVLLSLDVLGLGGETVSASDAASWGANTKVVIAYGPSECTVGCSVNNNVNGSEYTTIGKGVGGIMWIVDPADHDRLVPIGAIGELLVEGPIVGIGYLNELAKTQEVYIEDPEFLLTGTGTIPGRRGRLYKTGDLVRYDPDGRGEIVFVGRRDQQVKLRGQRIELAEIEYNMRKHLPTGTEVAVEVIKPGGFGEPTLVAFLTEGKENGTRCQNGDLISTFSKALRERMDEMDVCLAADLPAYMVPSAYIPLHNMPLMVSCKTDRKRLREIGSVIPRKKLRNFSSAKSERQTPSTDMERNLHRLWKAVLSGHGDFGTKDSFFAVGGDSLRAMRLVAAARDAGIALTVAEVMLHPTLFAMATKAQVIHGMVQPDVAPFSLIDLMWDAEDARAQVAELCQVSSSCIEDIYPCTPLQEGLMALSAKFTDAYVAQRVVELPNIETAQALWRAFGSAACDSHILRTRIVSIPGRGLFQVVVNKVENIKLASDLFTYLTQDHGNPMDLGDPLVRYAIVETPGSSSVHFVLTIHHALYDGWSMPLVVERVNRAYQGLETERPSSFKDFIKYLIGLDRPVSEAYWREKLKGVHPDQFPLLPHPGYQTRADSLLEHYITMKNSSSPYTIATIIRGAWALTTSLYMRSSDIIFGETLTGRSAPVSGIDQIEGPMITTVPIRVQLDLDNSVSQYLEQLHIQTVEQIPYEHLGLQHIRRVSPDARNACELRTGLVLHPKAGNSHNEKYDIMDSPASGLVPSNDDEAAREALKFNTYALMLVCTLDASGFLVMASFDSQTVTTDVMERMLHVFDKVVLAMCNDLDQRLGDVAVLTDDEERGAKMIRQSRTAGPASTERVLNRVNNSRVENIKVKASILLEREGRLRELWSRILNLPAIEISPTDTFFQLGGDSIGAMRLVSEARLANMKLSVAKIFEHRSLSSMAIIVEEVSSMPPNVIVEPFAALGPEKGIFTQEKVRALLANPSWEITNIYPTRPLQEVAVNGTVFSPRYSTRYELIYLSGSVNHTLLFNVCQKLVAYNEILRTVFLEVSGRCLGVVLKTLEVPVHEIPISEGGDLRTSALDFCNKDIGEPQLHGTSFVAFTLLTSSTGESCLAFRISHAQYDEICLPILLEQLSALYSGTVVAKTEPFSKHVNHVIFNKLQESIPYWQNLLKGSKMSTLMSSESLVARKSGTVYCDLDISGRPREITIATLPTAAWALCLSRRLSILDVVFGEVVSGRNIDLPSADRIIGPCWQYIPVRIQFQSSWTYRDLLEHVQAQHIESAAYEGIGLSEIISSCTDWDPGEITWFDSVVHQATIGVETLDFGGAEARVETVYPHAEPLREWKIQAFVEGDIMRVEIVTFKEWIRVAEELLGELEEVFGSFMGRPEERIC